MNNFNNAYVIRRIINCINYMAPYTQLTITNLTSSCVETIMKFVSTIATPNIVSRNNKSLSGFNVIVIPHHAMDIFKYISDNVRFIKSPQSNCYHARTSSLSGHDNLKLVTAQIRAHNIMSAMRSKYLMSYDINRPTLLGIIYSLDSMPQNVRIVHLCAHDYVIVIMQYILKCIFADNINYVYLKIAIRDNSKMLYDDCGKNDITELFSSVGLHDIFIELKPALTDCFVDYNVIMNYDNTGSLSIAMDQICIFTS